MNDGGIFDPSNLQLFSYAANNPIIFVDPTGEREILFYFNAFIPGDSAGLVFGGDNRENSLNPEDTARVHVQAVIDTDTGSVTSKKAYSSPTILLGGSSKTETPTANLQGKKNGSGGTNLSGSVVANDPWGGGIAPNVNIEINMNFTENKDGTLTIGGSILGEDYPAYEAYFSADNGKNFSAIGAKPVSKWGSPASLIGDGVSEKINVNSTYRFSNNKVSSVRNNKTNKNYSGDTWNTNYLNQAAEIK